LAAIASRAFSYEGVPALGIRRIGAAEDLGNRWWRQRCKAQAAQFIGDGGQGLGVGSFVADLDVAGQEGSAGTPDDFNPRHDKAVGLEGFPALALDGGLKAESAVVAEAGVVGR